MTNLGNGYNNLGHLPAGDFRLRGQARSSTDRKASGFFNL
jgi:hypothetical protein